MCVCVCVYVFMCLRACARAVRAFVLVCMVCSVCVRESARVCTCVWFRNCFDAGSDHYDAVAQRRRGHSYSTPKDAASLHLRGRALQCIWWETRLPRQRRNTTQCFLKQRAIT
ncbi:hypothetical protein M433DRAFT_166855 [Acidomyces richmondensis BFW]|nr:MAG: hypothetical protein FE78DRAFT_105250 [Acidomyces sp. 'richmondensis']KYG44601.1 hypothetical protein M433DRAFT_166855 [Acidomyces richmondensis BFW]